MNRKQRRANKKTENPIKKPSGGSDPFAELLKQGLEHHQAGRLADAEAIYRQILSMDTAHAHSLHMMGMLAFHVQRYDIAEDFVRKALAQREDIPAFFNTFGNILKAQEKFEDAIEVYEQALAIRPDSIEILNNLGALLFSLDRKEEALSCFESAVSLNPHDINSLNNVCVVLQRLQRHQDAIKYFYQILDVNPDHVDTHLNLGNAYRRQGKYDESLKHYYKALAIRPDGSIHAKIAMALQSKEQFNEAEEEYKKALAFTPNSFEALNNLGSLYSKLTRFEEALALYEKAFAIEPQNYEPLNNIAIALKDLGRLDEAIVYFKRALTLRPKEASIYCNLLLAMVYAASVSPEEFVNTAHQFGELVAAPLQRQRPFANERTRDRKLRIGYVSPDFCDHAVNYFFGPLLEKHDRSKFEIYAYSNTAKEDRITERIKGQVGHWRDIRFMNDEDIANLIEKDGIDILIDLAGPTAGNKLLVFARKPAPVQVTWMGFAGTTGVKAIDYRISDAYAEPPGMTEHLNAETLWRLPDIFCCYNPSENSPSVIDHPPFEDNGYITFGCFNNFAKVTDDVLRTWADIMKKVPDSRLLLEIKGIQDTKFREDTERRMEMLGFSLDRITLEPRKKSNQFVLYNKIDMALDPFPCAGGTTSMDTVWMGVPFITLAGKHFVSRMGVTILTNAGMPELIAKDTGEYVQLAVDLARDKERLKSLRHHLRERVSTSPVMDQQRFVNNMENAYRSMWRKFCESNAE